MLVEGAEVMAVMTEGGGSSSCSSKSDPKPSLGPKLKLQGAASNPLHFVLESKMKGFPRSHVEGGGEKSHLVFE